MELKIGYNVRTIRIQRGISQKELARRVGGFSGTYKRY